MTVPASLNTVDRAIRLGMTDAGKLAEGDDPTSEQLAMGIGRMNDIINHEATQGLKLWTQLDLSIPLIAGTGTYTIGPSGSVNMTRPMRVIDEGYYLDSNSISRPVFLISRDDYVRLANKISTGPINQYWVDKQQTQMVVKTWLVPDTQAATGTLHLAIQQQMTNFVSLTDTMNLPVEWFLWLRWAYATEISTGQPKQVIDRCEAKAALYRTQLEDWDVEDAPTSFQPNQQGVLVYRTR
jgi:hypothetical protein